MKREVTSRTVQRICDRCQKRPAGWTQCRICGCDVCEQCSASYVAGVGETDGHMVCNSESCRQKAEAAGRSCVVLQQAYLVAKSDLYQRFQGKCISIWERVVEQ